MPEHNSLSQYFFRSAKNINENLKNPHLLIKKFHKQNNNMLMNRFAVLTVIILLSCNSANDPQNQIKDYIKQNINDPASYEPVSFGEKLNDSTTALDAPEYKIMSDSFDYWSNKEKQAPTLERSGVYADSMLKQAFRMTFFAHDYKSSKGYKINHVFRKKSRAGGVVLDSMDFRFDSSMNLIDLGYKTAFNKD